MADGDFYGFGDDSEAAHEDPLTEDELERMKAISKQMAQSESDIAMTLRRYMANGDRGAMRVNIKGARLKGDDLKAWVIVKGRLLDTGMFTQTDFAETLIRHGLRSMLRTDDGVKELAAIQMAAMMSAPEQFAKIAPKLVRESLKAYEERQQKSVQNEFEPEPEDARMEAALEKEEVKP